MSDEDDPCAVRAQKQRREKDKTLVESSCLNYYNSISISNQTSAHIRSTAPIYPPSPLSSLSEVKPITTLKKTAILTDMASLAMTLAPANRIVFAAAASKSASDNKGEKGLLDWILGGLQKDQLVETDPILKKVAEKNGGTTAGKKNSVSIPPKKKGGFEGMFAKN